MRIVEIKEEFIELAKLLKFENLVASGGEAKGAITEGIVRVNGIVETHKSKKIYSGDIVDYKNEKIRIHFSETSTHDEINPSPLVKPDHS
ncbi:MAG: RNA-binding S4 domain-containing protein [Candidatus Riflebacteria bacterium]|nr:RNA-binding S4 domain-containing protein [Candidatus Riflebacteria bacterium]